MPDCDITLDGFEFPDSLGNDKANFRLVVEIWFSRSTEGTGEELVLVRSTIPSMDTFWECDTGKKDEVNYVRKHGESGIDIEKIAKPDRLLRVDATKFHFIRVTVHDVNRRDAWDRVKAVLEGIVRPVIGILTHRMPSATKEENGRVTEHEPRKVYGELADDLQSMLANKAAGGKDKSAILFQRTVEIEDATPSIKAYDYDVRFKIEAATTGFPAPDKPASKRGSS